jgi:glycosyltransferase involved in cell wall biosynthesis
MKDRIDILHAPGYVIPLLSSVPAVVTIPDVIALLFPKMCKISNHLHYRALLPAVAKKAKCIITMSHNSKKDIVNTLNVSEDKIDVIYNGVHPSFIQIHDVSRLDFIREKYDLPEKIILFVGNLEPKKNIVRLIDAYSLLKREQEIEHALVIIGKKGWLYDEIFKKVNALNMDKYIIFLGYVPREDLPLLYNMAEVFVFPSLYEGFGIPPLEAMACGTPVVTSNISSLPEVVGDAAIKVDPQNIRDIAEGVYKVVVNKDLTQRLIAKGLKRARLFSWEKTAKRTLEVYTKAVIG